MKPLVAEYLTATAAQSPDATALIQGETRVSYEQLERDSSRFAAALQHAGLHKGDRVAIMANNSIEMVVVLWAVLRAGGVFAPVNPTTKTDKLAYMLDNCGVRFVVAERRMARVVLPALAEAPTVTTALWIGGPPPSADGAGATRHLDYGAAVADEASVVADPGLIDADLGGLLHTSGSTGRPKGVMLTQRNIAHNTWSITTYLGLRPDDVIACLLPLSFNYGLFQVFTAASAGCALVLEQSFAYPLDVLARLADTKVTILPGVPTMFAVLLQLAPFDALDPPRDLSSVRMLTSAAAPLPPAHIHRLGKAFPDAQIVVMYGQTECTRISYLDPDRIFDKLESVGKAIPNTEAYVVDEEGRRVGPGVVGELVVRGAHVMRGYWQRPDATSERLRDGELEGEKVLYTGDAFYADEEGFLYFVSRRDDVFKCKGEKVSPKEIEDVIYELEAVAEVAVIGVPDEIDGNAVEAYVAPRPGAELSPDVVRNHCRQRLETYMVPRHVEVRAELPKTQSGKIRRAELLGERS
jgi:long-chain acyl-CoA synthetase